MDAKITNSNENKANPGNYSTQGFTGDPIFRVKPLDPSAEDQSSGSSFSIVIFLRILFLPNHDLPCCYLTIKLINFRYNTPNVTHYHFCFHKSI